MRPRQSIISTPFGVLCGVLFSLLLALSLPPNALAQGPAKQALQAVSLSAADATAQIPVGWTVGSQNPAIAQVFRPGREAPLVLQGVDASSQDGAMAELSLTLAGLGLEPKRFSDIDDATLPNAMLFSGRAPDLEGQARSYYGIVRLSGFGGGLAVWTLGPGLDEKDWRDVAGVARRVTFKTPPPPKLEAHRVGIPGLGFILEVPARGYAATTPKDGSLVLGAAKPMRRVSVEIVKWTEDEPALVERLLASLGADGGEVIGLPDGGAYGVAPGGLDIDGHSYDAIVFARKLEKGLAYRGMYAVRFDMDKEQRRQALALFASISVKPEPKSAAAKAAEAQLGGKQLLAGLGSSSDSMGWNASASTSEKWTFCSNGSYAYDYQSVISLGELGGSVKEDRHSGGWIVVDGSKGGLILLLNTNNRGRLMLPLKVQRNGIFINGHGFRFGKTDRCR